MKGLLLVFIMLIGTAALAHDIGREAKATSEITAYLMDWTKNLAMRHWRRAAKHIASAAHWSTYYNVDPLLVSVTITLESSWDPNAQGDIGEIGLMQLHSPEAKRGFDLTDPNQQIEAGVKWLRTCIDQCGGDVRQGVNKYATGECKKPWGKLDYRMRRYRRAVRLFREE